MKRYGRAIRVGIVVGLIFFGWYMRELYIRNYRFRLFSLKDWQYVWNQFKTGWVIRTPYEWSWLLMVTLMVPIFLILWWVSVKISWRKSFMTVFRKVRAIIWPVNKKSVIKKKIKLKTQASHKKVRPLPMAAGAGRPAVKQTGRTMDANVQQPFGQNVTAPAQPTMAPQAMAGNMQMPAFDTTAMSLSQPNTEHPAFLDDEINNIPLDEIKLPERIRLEEDLVAILSNANYQVIKDATLGKLKTTYVGVSTDKVVVCLTDIEKGDWLADEEFFNDEEPLWFSESSHRVSPVYALLTAAKGFAKKMTDNGLSQELVPILIEKEGTIINAADMTETWKKMGVVVCRTDLGGPEELPSFGTALPAAADKGTSDTLAMIQNLF